MTPTLRRPAAEGCQKLFREIYGVLAEPGCFVSTGRYRGHRPRHHRTACAEEVNPMTVPIPEPGPEEEQPPGGAPGPRPAAMITSSSSIPGGSCGRTGPAGSPGSPPAAQPIPPRPPPPPPSPPPPPPP